MSEFHVVFGAGQVGFPLAERLLAAGKRVRIARRSSGRVPAGCEIVLGDAADTGFCVSAARAASAVYHCMNPPYDHRIWAQLLPRYMDNLIAAASAADARLVVLDNVYMLGRPNGRQLNEDTPMNPCSRKGEIRARLAERLFDAHRAWRRSLRPWAGPRTSMDREGRRPASVISSGRARSLTRRCTRPSHWMRFTPITTSRTWRSGLALLGCARV